MMGADFVFFLFLVVLGSLYVMSMTNERRLSDDIVTLKASLSQTEEQTRLIIKTDLELSQTQEEFDKQLTSFKSLQNVAQIISSILEEEQIFAALSEQLIADLGFGFCGVFVRTNGVLRARRVVGYADIAKVDGFAAMLEDKNIIDVFSQERLLVSDGVSRIPEQIKQFLENEVKLTSYMLCPLRSKGSALGMVVFGNFAGVPLQEGLREIVEVFITQLAQALENIHMFEEIYRSKQELEFHVKERTTDLEKAFKELERANKRKTEFVSAVSHEFRTPLTSIKGYAALLAGGKFGDLPEGIQLRLNRINEQADALVGMINDLLDIARIESGRVQIAVQSTDLAEIIKGQIDMFYPQLQEKKLAVHATLPEKAMVEADKKLVQRVILNLMSNAIKFTPGGRNIYVTMVEKPDAYQVTVKDEGIGVPAADIPKLFSEFFRVDTPEHREVKGTGLGLSLARNIIKAHKGDIWIESDLGKGAAFIFTLPKKFAQGVGSQEITGTI